MFHVEQFRNLILEPILSGINLYSEAAENLLVGTALVESELYYLHQKNGGALGFFQIEPETYEDLIKRVNDNLKKRILFTLGYIEFPKVHRLKSDIGLSVVIARLKYYLHPSPLPKKKDDLFGLAKYWSTIYNTRQNPDSERRFINLYKKYG